MSSIQKQFSQLSIEFQNFKLNPSKLSGTFRINNMYGLKADAEAKTDDWKVYVSETGDTIPWMDIPQTFLSTTKEFIGRWNSILAGEQKDPLNEPSTPDSTGEETTNEALEEKLAKMDRLEQEKAEAEEVKIQEMEKREKVKEATHKKSEWREESDCPLHHTYPRHQIRPQQQGFCWQV